MSKETVLSGSEHSTFKTCPSCGETKPTSEFSRNNGRKDGLQFYCKACQAAMNVAYRETRKKAYADVVVPAVKVCARCGEEKPASEFYVDKRRKDGLYSHCKMCHSVIGADYRKANPEKVAAKNARYSLAHKEEIAARARAWQKANPEKAAARLQAWREANPEYVLERQRKWREAHPEYDREWKKQNPEKVAASVRNYRARKRNAPGTHTAEDVQAQYDRQKGHCKWCDCKVGNDYHVDHAVPLSKGGSNWPSNLVISCPSCNISKNDKHPMDYAGVLF